MLDVINLVKPAYFIWSSYRVSLVVTSLRGPPSTSMLNGKGIRPYRLAEKISQIPTPCAISASPSTLQPHHSFSHNLLYTSHYLPNRYDNSTPPNRLTDRAPHLTYSCSPSSAAIWSRPFWSSMGGEGKGGGRRRGLGQGEIRRKEGGKSSWAGLE